MAFTFLVAAAVQRYGHLVWCQSKHEIVDIREWRPPKSYEVPSGVPLATADGLIGTWVNISRLEGSMLELSRRQDGGIAFHFSSWGCLGSNKADGTASFSYGGVVVLSRLVEPYNGEVYDRLFFVNRKQGLCLVPAGTVERGRDLSNGHLSEQWVDYFSLIRSVDRKDDSDD